MKIRLDWLDTLVFWAAVAMLIPLCWHLSKIVAAMVADVRDFGP